MLVACFGFGMSAHASLLYSIEDLGTLDGNEAAWQNVFAADINDKGEVVGSTNALDPGGDWFSFIWSQANGMQDLGTFGANSMAMSINNNSMVVGSSGINSNPGSFHAYLWDEASGMQDLGTLGGDSLSQANGINSFGAVVGKAAIPSISQHAFLWDTIAGMQDLGTLGGSWSEAYDINDLGQVVGTSRTTGLTAHAFLWDDTSGMVDLGSLGDSSYLLSINNSGIAVGYYFQDSTLRAMIWDISNGMLDLGDLGGGLSVAHDINEQGFVVGGSRTNTNTVNAFIWDSTNGMSDLNDLLVDASDWKLTDASAINASGQIVGNGLHNGLSRSYLLTPLSVPEPATLALFGIGLAGLVFARRKKST